VWTRGHFPADGGHFESAAAGGRGPGASVRDGGRQEPLELHEIRAARPGCPRPPGEGLHAVPGPRDAAHRQLYGGENVRRVSDRRRERFRDSRQLGRLRGGAAVRPAVVHGAVHRQLQPFDVRRHGPGTVTGRRRLRPVRHGTAEQRVRVARGPMAGRPARLRRAHAPAALDRNGRVWPLLQPGGRHSPVRRVRRARHVVPAVAQRGPPPVHRLRELLVHGRRGTSALRPRAVRQTCPGVRQHAPRY